MPNRPVQAAAEGMPHERPFPGEVARQILADAATQAGSKFKAVRVHAKLISEYMGEMHGGIWSVDIDHEAGFVLIRPSLRNEREKV